MGMYDERQRRKSASLVSIIVSGIIMVIFFVAVFAGDSIRESLTQTPEAMLIFDGMMIVSLMLLCVLALVGFYLYKVIKDYRLKKAFPANFWSTAGIVKKCVALLCVILVMFLFINNLVKVVNDCNAGCEEVSYQIVEIMSNDGKSARFTYYDENGDIKNATCAIFHSVEKFDASSGSPVYKFQIYKQTGFWIAIEHVKDTGV